MFRYVVSSIFFLIVPRSIGLVITSKYLGTASGFQSSFTGAVKGPAAGALKSNEMTFLEKAYRLHLSTPTGRERSTVSPGMPLSRTLGVLGRVALLEVLLVGFARSAYDNEGDEGEVGLDLAFDLDLALGLAVDLAVGDEQKPDMSTGRPMLLAADMSRTKLRLFKSASFGSGVAASMTGSIVGSGVVELRG